jgi:hypothetical protein
MGLNSGIAGAVKLGLGCGTVCGDEDTGATGDDEGGGAAEVLPPAFPLDGLASS